MFFTKFLLGLMKGSGIRELGAVVHNALWPLFMPLGPYGIAITTTAGY